jgi:cytochrome c7-like protein
VGLARVYLIAIVCGACSSPRVAEAPLPPTDSSRLSHAQHAAIACVDCHRMGQRPGSDDHKPCDGCHRAAFLGQPGELCKVCHTKVTVSPLEAKLKPYPVEDIWQAEAPRFSHQTHLDAGAVERAVGFHVQCADCHVRDGKLARPDHETCARCHAPEASGPGLVTMGQCAGCHLPAPQLRTHAQLIRGDLKPFDHETHRSDRHGNPIKCEQCHQKSAAADETAHPSPSIASCVSCHDDSDRAPEGVKMRECGACHIGREQSVATLAPRSHLPATEKPIDHTIGFRTDHAEAARDGSRCATCHTQMSGNAQDTCDECHQTMRPADHRITFRELDHGPEAIAHRDRCATCHVVAFCTACHSQRPRSHGFPNTFQYDHAAMARDDVRACLTCHVDERAACTGNGCHSSIVGPPSGKK